MTAALLLAEACAAGIKMTAQGDRLHIEAKTGTLTAEFRDRLAAEKKALLFLLIARDRLLALAEAEGLPADLVTGMDAAETASWAWFADQPDCTDQTLRKCLRTLAVEREGSA